MKNEKGKEGYWRCRWISQGKYFKDALISNENLALRLNTYKHHAEIWQKKAENLEYVLGAYEQLTQVLVGELPVPKKKVFIIQKTLKNLPRKIVKAIKADQDNHV